MKHIENLIRPALLLASVFLLGGCGSDHSSDKVQLWEGGPYWATKNIGAEKPEDYGLYFWWGDTVGYYRKNGWRASDESGFRRFEAYDTPTDNKSDTQLQSDGWVVSKNGTYVLAPEHDAAHFHWGGAWRMPTDQELKDLANKCDWTWTTKNDVSGFIIRGKNGYSSASIFLPAAAGCAIEDDISHSKMGFYWSSVPGERAYLSPDGPALWEASWSLSCGWGHDPEINREDRHIGQAVRPVQGFAEEITYCAEVAKRVTHERAKASQKVAAAAEAARNHGKVQLWKGGPYWADKNIGAEKPEDYGLYFWWGDTVGYRREGDAWVASDGSSSSFSFAPDNAPTDNKDIATLQREGWIVSKAGSYVLVPQHDAAHVHWGGAWRMPTDQEFKDLKDKCDWMWTTINGVNGYIVSGKDDYASASIFLPAAGGGGGSLLFSAGSDGNYWSSVPYESRSDLAWHLNFSFGLHYAADFYRCYGQSVRPVQGFAE